jgi:voltage-gated potassium channel
MSFVRQASAAAILVTLTLWFQCAGMGALIHWGRDHLARSIQQAGPLGSAVLLVRFTNLIICLHLLEILLWAWFYRWFCFPSWEVSFYYSTTSYSTVGYGDVLLPRMWRTLGPIESVTDVPDVRLLREPPVRYRDPARGARKAALIRRHKSPRFDDFSQAKFVDLLSLRPGP